MSDQFVPRTINLEASMNAYVLTSLVCAGLVGLLWGCQNKLQSQPAPQMLAGSGEQSISGPYTHKNLTVFLIHGPDTIKGANYLTLGEALEQKKVVVYETDNVNELAIENVSDQPVFIQSGDIVKGGKQDRTMGSDLICSARSGKIPIAAFCVEQGRWEQRGGESAARFSNSDAMVVGNAMKIAANTNSGKSDQGRVWQSVAENQGQLSQSAGVPVASTASPSSLQLTLENEKVEKSTAEYATALSEALKGKHDAIGYAVVVNGKISSADVYGSHALFTKVWPKLIKSSSVEAFAVLKPDSAKPPMVSADDVRKFLDNAEKAQAQRKQVNARTGAVTYDGNDSILLQTDDAEAGSAPLRRSYISKSEQK
jgi:hypothetical protein